MIPLPSRDPGDIANAARCFSSCVPGVGQLALRTYLLTQVANIATPPCITPASPVIAVLPALTTNTSITVAWNFAGNQGSLVNGYEVFWGTATGVYTNNSGRLPPGPVGSIRSYMISGLTAGTAYFIVVVALTTIAGCQSANSNEVSATTSGAAPGNHLLVSLTSYWKFDDDEPAGANTVDSIGANPLTLSANAVTGNTFCPGGIINGACCLAVGSTQASHANAAGGDFDPALSSFSISLWVISGDWTSGPLTQGIILNNGNPSSNLFTGPYMVYIDHASGHLVAALTDSGANLVANALTLAFPTNNVFHHVVFTFDAAAKLFSVYYDGNFIGSSNTVTGGLQQNAGGNFILGPGVGNSALVTMKIDEVGMWHKALSASDVTTLFNGGAALPLASFTV